MGAFFTRSMDLSVQHTACRAAAGGGTIEAVDIRPAGVGDAIGLGWAHVRSWQTAYRGLVPQHYLERLDPVQRGQLWARQLSGAHQVGEAVLVADADGEVVGFVSVGPSRDEGVRGQGEVWAIYVLPDFWGQGLGSALLGAGTESLRRSGFTEATLWVLDSNVRARRFYEAAGWAPDGGTKQDDSRGFPVTEVRYRRRLGRQRLASPGSESDG